MTDVDLAHLAEVCLPGFSAVELPLCVHQSLGGSRSARPALKGGKLCPASLRAECAHRVFEIFLHWIFVSPASFIYLIIYLYQHRLMEVSYFGL